MENKKPSAPCAEEALARPQPSFAGPDGIGLSSAGGPSCPGQPRAHTNGWLDPEGRFYSLELPNQHCQWCLENNLVDCSRSLEKTHCPLDERGWVKLSKGTWIIFLPYKVTQRQIDFVYDWYLNNHREPDDLIKLLRELNK